MIIETSGNQLFAVREPTDEALNHCWIGRAVKRAAGRRFVFKSHSLPILVRKAATKVISADATATEA